MNLDTSQADTPIRPPRPADTHAEPPRPAAPATLTESLRPAAVDVARLGQEVGSLLRLVRLLIGVVPNCDGYLAIWPPGFRTYNLLVPNCLNLPFSIWGWGPPVVPLGLALYTASWTARCAYCTAHTCAFALRRGAPPAALAAGDGSPANAAAIAAAEALAEIPCAFTPAHRQALLGHFSARDAERLALGIALMGFLNKFMDAMGIDLEEASVREVSAVLLPTGWTPGKHRVTAKTSADPAFQPRPGGRDTLATKLGLLRYVPAAIRLESGWTRGVPARWPAAGRYLAAHTGHDFPLLAKVRSPRAVRAIATVLRDNLDPGTSRLGLGVKALCGLVYASAVGNEGLAAEARWLTVAHAEPAVPAASLAAIARFGAAPAAAAGEPGGTAPAASADSGGAAGGDRATARAALAALPGVGAETALALLLAKAISPSPAAPPPSLLAEVAAALSPEAQIELVVWVSVQQMLHRLGGFLDAVV
jgi:alkylhydroperoxidase family enzyme